MSRDEADPTVERWMTRDPHTVPMGESLTAATRRMRQLGIRHMPVVEDERVRGILSERDVGELAILGTVDFEKSTVADAMTPDPYTVAPSASMADVVRTMVQGRQGSILVVDAQRLVGIVCATDALRALAELLDPERTDQADAPSEVRRRVLGVHDRLRHMIADADDVARRVLEGSEQDETPLRVRSGALLRALTATLELEAAVLAPTLRQTDAFGEERAAALGRSHEEQRRLFESMLSPDKSAAELARDVHRLAGELLAQMERGEHRFLDEELLRDDPIRVPFTG